MKLHDGCVVSYTDTACGKSACNRRAMTRARIAVENAKEEANDHMNFCNLCGHRPDVSKRIVCTWCWSFVWCCQEHMDVDKHACAEARQALKDHVEETVEWCKQHALVGLGSKFLQEKIEMLKHELHFSGVKHERLNLYMAKKKGVRCPDGFRKVPKGTVTVEGQSLRITYVMPGTLGGHQNVCAGRDTRLRVGICKSGEIINVTVLVGTGPCSGKTSDGAAFIYRTFDSESHEPANAAEGISIKVQWCDSHPLDAAIGRQQSILKLDASARQGPTRSVLRRSLIAIKDDLVRAAQDVRAVSALDRLCATINRIDENWHKSSPTSNAAELVAELGLNKVQTSRHVSDKESGTHSIAFKLLCILSEMNQAQ